MNRKERRASQAEQRRDALRPAQQAAEAVERLLGEARSAYQREEFARARDLARLATIRAPAHAIAHNLLGVILQDMREDKAASRHLAKAVALEDNAVFHYNLAFSYQRLDRWSDAVAHFTRAIAMRMDGKAVEDLVMHYPPVAACLDRIAQHWPRRLTMDELFGTAGLKPIAEDAFLRCALEKTELASLELENLLATIRYGLLQRVLGPSVDQDCDGHELGFYAAIAQQCFIGEYILPQNETESRQVDELATRVSEDASAGEPIAPLTLVTLAAYAPLDRLATAETLRNREWPPALDGLLRQQLDEPTEERAIRATIPRLTPIAGAVSREVLQQYEENPYPRWTLLPDVATGDGWRARFAPPASAPADILVAGCGTGLHPIQIALELPGSRILAVDLSSTSLAYAARKAREAGVRGIEFAQADILELGGIGRNFDRIESVGVLHHMADPHAGWRVLVSLLRPNGLMEIGLYSETARRAIVAARALIAERGYRSSTEDIRRFRQDVRRLPGDGIERGLVSLKDFYTVSGCRDLLFNVMEHRFTIPDIAAFLQQNGLSFLGFRLPAAVTEKFRAIYPDPPAITDLACWHAFEQTHPQTFLAMYRFAARKQA